MLRRPSLRRRVRRIVLGDRARDDRKVTEDLARLRARANWVYLRAVDRRRRASYRARLAAYLRSAERGNLVERARAYARDGDADKVGDQVTHWLFAFDAAGITTFRALALFASHPPELERAASDILAWCDWQMYLPYLSAGFLEAMRLWPTTPVVLRETICAGPVRRSSSKLASCSLRSMGDSPTGLHSSRLSRY
jgi:hypothetical protein